jgi:signal transduction histidine kinase
MKIRIRLTSWYFGISLIILIIFSLATYLGMRRLLFDALDKELNILAETIERDYDPFFGHFQGFLFEPDNINRYLDHYLLVYNTSRDLIYASPMTQLIKLNIPLPKNNIEMAYLKEFTVEKKTPYLFSSPGKITFRVIARQLFSENRFIGWVVIGLPIERIQDSMDNLIKVLAVSILFAVVLVGSASYILTKRALSPINQITRKATRISYSNLSERIEVANPEDELGRLTEVLNNLLDRLEKAFESQKEFLADAAHELKTPLSTLRAYWEGELNNPKISLDLKEKMVQDIETISRLSHLINNLLLLSQTESIRSNFEFSEVKMDDLIREVVADVEVLAEMKQQTIDIVELPPTTVYGDQARLYQLFFNIIDNAAKYTPENGKIWISLRPVNSFITVEVRDNGSGIPKEQLPHIFQRFYRVQKDRSRSTGGSGLGLSICKLIADSHGGHIEVESEVGKGSMFRIILPQNMKQLN